jgi:hypothetical protein
MVSAKSKRGKRPGGREWATVAVGEARVAEGRTRGDRGSGWRTFRAERGFRSASSSRLGMGRVRGRLYSHPVVLHGVLKWGLAAPTGGCG